MNASCRFDLRTAGQGLLVEPSTGYGITFTPQSGAFILNKDGSGISTHAYGFQFPSNPTPKPPYNQNFFNWGNLQGTPQTGWISPYDGQPPLGMTLLADCTTTLDNSCSRWVLLKHSPKGGTGCL